MQEALFSLKDQLSLQEVNEQMNSKEHNNYVTHIQNDIHYSDILEDEESEGFTTNEYQGKFFMSDYTLCKTRNNLELPLYNTSYELYSADKITYFGLLEKCSHKLEFMIYFLLL